MKLNADVGEGFGVYKFNDEKLMPLIDMANIACGFHAGDSMHMEKTVLLAKKYNVLIGAHPSYPDRVGFGRRSIKCTPKEIENDVIYQVGALSGFCKLHKIEVSYIKPHGALYNDMMKDIEIFRGVLNAAKVFNLPLMILSTNKNEYYKKIANEFGVELIFEAFLDRAYEDSGFLVSRLKEGAVLSPDEMLKRAVELKNGYITSINGKKLTFKVDSVCVHGDNEDALKIIKEVREIISGC